VLATGTLLDGKYEIRGRLAGGGMGEVYLAHRTLLGDDVAVKLIRPSGPDPAVWRARFLRESRACAQLRHPNIVTILDYNADDPDQPYLVMEYLNGPSLAEELRARGTFDLGTVQHVMRSVGSALNMAHANGMVHRDLKPQNVVSHRFESGEVVHKVIDFGLVNVATGETPLTEAHEFLGTVAYASPEQFSGETTSVFSDQYSLGVIIYELLAGVRPIQGDGFLVLVDQHLNASPVPLGERRPDLPVGAVSAVMRALAKNPRDRWPSIAALVQALGEDDENPTVAVSMPRPSLLGIYELGPVIAQGRFGSEIHSGTHRALGIPVAIRIFRTLTHADREAVRSRFLKEARALQVPHPNLIHVRDFGEDGDLLYVVTDLLEGCSLAERLARDCPLPLPLLDTFLREIADATSALHKRGGLVSGLHPGIIRVVRDGDSEHVAISTAGVAQIQDVLSTLDEQTLRAQSTDDSELHYVAPELLTGKTATVRSDIYTLGVVGYEMATGVRPYDATTLPLLLGQMLEGPPPNPRTVRPDLPEMWAATLMRALKRSPDDRFGSASDLLASWIAPPGGGLSPTQPVGV
jgi:serine/threonine protein kinase